MARQIEREGETERQTDTQTHRQTEHTDTQTGRVHSSEKLSISKFNERRKKHDWGFP